MSKKHSSRGFSYPGIGQLVNLTGLRGKRKREALNRFSSIVVVICGAVGAFIGYNIAGAFGCVCGFIAALLMGGIFAERKRFYRG